MTVDVDLQMLHNLLTDELIENEHEDFIYQQGSAPPHWKLTVRAMTNDLNDNLTGRWIGRASGADNVMLKLPRRSPDLTPCDFLCEDV